MSATKYIRGACKCCCKVGSVVPRWQNVTLTKPGDVAPEPRLDAGDTDANSTHCGPGTYCDPWLVGGDLNGLPAQFVTDTVPDIDACTAPDATHATSDHNCYQKTLTVTAGGFVNGFTYQILTIGTTDFTAVGAASNTVGLVFIATGLGSGTGTAELVVDYRRQQRFGGKWVLARKFWQGKFGAIDQNDPHIINGFTFDATGGTFTPTYGDATATPAPPQSKWRTISVVSTGRATVPGVGDFTGLSVNGSSTIDRYSGIKTKTGSESDFTAVYAAMGSGFLKDTMESAFDTSLLDWNTLIGGYMKFVRNAFDHSNTYVVVSSTVFQLWQDLGFGSQLSEQVTVTMGTCSRNYYAAHTFPGDTSQVVEETESVSVGNTVVTYSWSQSNIQDAPTGTTASGSATATYSDEYTSTDCLGDFYALINAWDLTDDNVYPWRTDEELANAPLIVYDEVGPNEPSPSYTGLTMDDFRQTQNLDSTWPQTGWIDGNNFVWVYGTSTAIAAGSYSFNQPAGFTGGVPGESTVGAAIITPMRTGAIVSHNPAGSDRHFWFDYLKYRRASGPPVEYIATAYGGFSDYHVPATTMRWMDKLTAQYDAYLSVQAFANPGNFPQAFLKEQGSILTGAKYVVATQDWPGVNYSLTSTWGLTITCAGVDMSAQPAAGPSLHTGVRLEYSFNQRALAPGYTGPLPGSLPGGAWYASVAGCTGCPVNQQFTYTPGACQAVIGYVPFTEGSPLESFTNQVMFAMPDTFAFDDLYGSVWQSAIMLTMQDPLYVDPTPPACDGVTWKQDYGCGTANGSPDAGDMYFPHSPLVEASNTVPAGKSLPSGVYLPLDPAHNQIAPPQYPNGIPMGDDNGNYGTVETDWGFALRACFDIANGRQWASFYQVFVNCNDVAQNPLYGEDSICP